jgi:hypothetical protein
MVREPQVVGQFISALRSDPRAAWRHVTAVYNGVDFGKLQEVLSSVRFVVGREEKKNPGPYRRTHSLCIHNEAGTFLMHFSLVRLPRGGWKIRSVELE